MDEFLIGSCELQLSKLYFAAGREPNQAAIAKLVELFKLSCAPEDHQIPVVLSPEELQLVLGESAISLDNLVQRQVPRPKLTPSGKLCGIHARQRYEAAIRVFGPHMWWTVRLYCIPAGSDISKLLPKETDQYYYQTAPSDGEVFLKVRGYEESDRADCAALWRLRLSTCKQVALRALERHDKLLDKFDQLRAFPGLWDGFQLGNIQRCNALHATEEVLHYLEHIFDVWGRMTLNDPTIQQATDATTVQHLELLAPAVSSLDSDTVRNLIESRQLFRDICDPTLRHRLQDAILQVSVLIPSIRTFHENMKLLTIGMMILRDHVIDRLGARSVRAAMAACWEPPGSKCVLEYQEDAFYEVDSRPTVETAYRQVFMAALRNFSHLSANSPRRERGQKPLTAAVDNVHLASFLRGVQRQGFRSQKVAASLGRLRACPTPRSSAMSEAPFTESALNRRCGRPFAKSYSVLRASFYLPNTLAERNMSQPCTLFVQENFMCSFFGKTPVVTLASTFHQREQGAVSRDTTLDTGHSRLAEAMEVSDPNSPSSEGRDYDHPESFQSTGLQACPSTASAELWRMSSRTPENASTNLCSPPPTRHTPPSRDNTSMGSGGRNSTEHRALNVDIDTLRLLDPLTSFNARRYVGQSVQSTTTYESSRSLVYPESLNHHRMASGSTTSSSRKTVRDPHSRWRLSRRSWSPPPSSHASRSMYSPRQWLASMPERSALISQPMRDPGGTSHHPSSPETSLPTSGTSTSSRSLIFPDAFHVLHQVRPDYIMQQGNSILRSPGNVNRARSICAGSSWRGGSFRSEDSMRSVFGPEEIATTSVEP